MTIATQETSISLKVPAGPVVVIDETKVIERNQILGRSYLVKSCETSDKMQEASNTLKELDTIAREVTKQGEKLRAPFTKLAKDIKAVADQFTAPLDEERTRIGGLIKDQVTREARAAAELERKRQEEIAEVERKRQEEARKATEAMQKAETEEAYAKAAEAKRVADIQAERERRRIESEKAAEVQKSPGVVVRENWKFRVVDMAKVPSQFTKTVVNEIAVQVAIDNGSREIDGLEIYDAGKAFTRA